MPSSAACIARGSVIVNSVRRTTFASAEAWLGSSSNASMALPTAVQ
jgi:hypothetical protein